MLALMISILITLSSYKNTFYKSFWSFIDPLVGKGNSLSLKCFSYALYLIALIPFIEIIRNELHSSLLVMKEIKFDTIEELLDPKVVVIMFKDPIYWLKESARINDVELSIKLQLLFKKIDKQFNSDDWMILIQNKDKFRKVGRNYALIEDEFSMRWFKVNSYFILIFCHYKNTS